MRWGDLPANADIEPLVVPIVEPIVAPIVANHATLTDNPHSTTCQQVNAEPNLGNPQSDGQVLSSNTSGTRSWVTPGAGSVDITQVEVNFGAEAVRSKTFTITDAQVTPSTQIIATQAGDAPTGKNADDNEMDAIVFRAVPGSGQFTLYATVVEGFKVGGFYKVNYLRG